MTVADGWAAGRGRIAKTARNSKIFRTDVPTDTARCRIACPRLKITSLNSTLQDWKVCKILWSLFNPLPTTAQTEHGIDSKYGMVTRTLPSIFFLPFIIVLTQSLYQTKTRVGPSIMTPEKTCLSRGFFWHGEILYQNEWEKYVLKGCFDCYVRKTRPDTWLP